MYWKDEGYLLSKNNFNENSIIMEAFTLDHGKCFGTVYGGSSKKNKKIFQIGNKISINYKSKNENRIGYFTIELIKPISPTCSANILLKADSVEVFVSLKELANILSISLYLYWI